MQNNSLFESLFKRNSAHPGTTEFLEQLTKDHPYFSPAQFYLLRQTGVHTPAYNTQAARTAVFFDNSYWLNFQLAQSRQSFVERKEEPVKEIKLGSTEPDNIENNNHEAVLENETVPTNPELKNSDENRNTKNDDPLFEPMHLADYFASQGIKLSEEVLVADKLGKQLKSFTEWLKTMKKVHSPDAGPRSSEGFSEKPGEQTDTSIQILAEKSNAEEDVLTESMADVLAKQGKTGRAVELYQKLSLLDPSKNAYFAAKIEQLKGI